MRMANRAVERLRGGGVQNRAGIAPARRKVGRLRAPIWGEAGPLENPLGVQLVDRR